MQPPDAKRPPGTRDDQAPELVFPDDVARSEHDDAQVSFDPDTGRRLKRAVVIALVALLVGFLAVRGLRFVHDRGIATASQRSHAAAPLVDVVIVRAASAGQSLTLPGQTAAWFESPIYARVNGYVGKWLVDIGDRVHKGQLLAVIETPELDAELNAALAQLKATDAQLIARQAEAEFARTTHERWRDSPKGVVSDQERDAKKADYEAAAARVYAAKAQVAQDSARVAQYRALAEFKEVRAPFDGMITERHIDIGHLVAAGSGAATSALYRISQNAPLRVFVDVPQSLADELMQPGVPAEVKARGGSATPSRGKVVRAAQAISAQARTMRIEVDLPNAEHELVPGMYVTVAFMLEPRGIVEAPAAALMFRSGGPEVARIGAGSRVEFVPVTIARDNGSLVELASGVAPGDRLVLNISSQIAAGDVVKVNDEEPRAGARPVAAP
jgi:RND family efflux transporter MFP subunit